MPLSEPAVPRELIHDRRIHCAGYQRDDGQWEIEGELTDVKGFPVDNAWRGVLAPGTPVHLMVMRVVIGDDLVIRDVEVHLDASPYAVCRNVEPNFLRIKGLRIGPGFTKLVQGRIDRIDACTHTSTLLQMIAATAMQTMVSRNRGRSSADIGIFSTTNGARPPLLGTCHAYRPDGEIARRLWPEHAKPPLSE